MLRGEVRSSAKTTDIVIHSLLLGCASLSIFTTLGLIFVLLSEASGFFASVSIKEFLTGREWTPLFINKHFGVLPLVLGTLLTSLIAVLIAFPLGLIIAVYLSEFASSRFRQIIKPLLEILAGIPSIVFGYFALLTVTPLLQKVIPGLATFNALSAGVSMGIMILPMVTSLSEDALFSVPRSLREGAYALGASKLQMIWGVLLRAALGGIIASFILSFSRAVGETMIVAIAAGQQPSFSFNPLEGVQTMTAYIVQVSLGDTPQGTLEFQTIFAVAALLFALTFCLNSLSISMRDRYQRKLV